MSTIKYILLRSNDNETNKIHFIDENNLMKYGTVHYSSTDKKGIIYSSTKRRYSILFNKYKFREINKNKFMKIAKLFILDKESYILGFKLLENEK